MPLLRNYIKVFHDFHDLKLPQARCTPLRSYGRRALYGCCDFCGRVHPGTYGSTIGCHGHLQRLWVWRSHHPSRVDVYDGIHHMGSKHYRLTQRDVDIVVGPLHLFVLVDALTVACSAWIFLSLAQFRTLGQTVPPELSWNPIKPVGLRSNRKRNDRYRSNKFLSAFAPTNIADDNVFLGLKCMWPITSSSNPS